MDSLTRRELSKHVGGAMARYMLSVGRGSYVVLFVGYYNT